MDIILGVLLDKKEDQRKSLCLSAEFVMNGKGNLIPSHPLIYVKDSYF